MNRVLPFVYFFIYLLVAVELEFGVIPQLAEVMPQWLRSVLAFQFLALIGILVGLLRGEIPGVIIALCASVIYGFAHIKGYLGASVISFSCIAYVAGWSARHWRLIGPHTQWAVIFILIVFEDLLNFFIRWLFWPLALSDKGFQQGIHGLFFSAMLTAIWGVIIYRLILTNYKIDLIRQAEDRNLIKHRRSVSG